MANYSNLAEVADSFTNHVGLNAQASLHDWESALKELCKQREAAAHAAKTPALKIKAIAELNHARGALRLITQKALFEKLDGYIKERSRRLYEATLAKTENKALVPIEQEAAYDDWMRVLNDADKAFPATPPQATSQPPGGASKEPGTLSQKTVGSEQLVEQAHEAAKDLNDEIEPMRPLRKLERGARAEAPPSTLTQKSTPPPMPSTATAENRVESTDQVAFAGPLRAGQKLAAGRFVLMQPLGRGGMSEVWLAQDERLRVQVALKFLPPEIRKEPVALDDLRRETASSHMLAHPNIVRIHDLHEEPGGLAFIAMEFVSGLTLSSLRVQQPQRVLSWGFLRPLVEQLCAALDYAHGEMVIHGDLKPANMMVDARGRLKLADFGIAAVASESLSRVSSRHTTSGTLPYMSPQQLAGRQPQVTDDIYALGASLYELLTSKPPFYIGDITHQVLHNTSEPMDKRLAALNIQNSIPPNVVELVMACLAKEPSQRPQSARLVAQRIVMLLSDHLPSSETQTSVPVAPLVPTFVPVLSQLVGKATPPQPSLSSLSDPTSPAPEESKTESAPRLADLAASALPKQPLLVGRRWSPPPASTPAETLPSAAPDNTKPALAKVRMSRVMAVVGAMAVIVLLCGAYLIFFRPRNGVTLTTEPPGASVALQGQTAQRSPATFNGLWPGAYHVAIRADGYEPVDRDVRVKFFALHATNLGTIKLPRSAGTLRLASTPPKASFQVEQVRSAAGVANEWKPRTGLTPANVDIVPTGTYKVVLQLSGWPQYINETNSVEKGKTTVFDHEFPGGTVTLSTEPARAILVIDGRTNGTAPAALRLPAGRHELVVRGATPGYEPSTHELEIVENIPINLETIKLARSSGTLQVASSPAGLNYKVQQIRSEADIASEWSPQSGITPANLIGLPTGSYKVVLQRPGWADFVKELTVDRQNSALVEHLFAEGTISVSTKPTGATIFVDGTMVGRSPTKITVDAVRHEVRATYNNWPEAQNVQQVDLERDQSKNVEFVLGGTVIVTSDPTGAEVEEGANELGHTSLTLTNIEPGTVSYKIKRKGYIEALVSSNVAAGQVLTLRVPLDRAWPKANRFWTNSLGMIFAPVADTGVLFSIWDTRASDYQAFVSENKLNWVTGKGRPNTNDPATMVSWSDAVEFCAWLTRKDRQAELLSNTQRIRLPWDAEWSIAVGLGKETGTTPAEKSDQVPDVYPWGKWPPSPEDGKFKRELYSRQPSMKANNDNSANWSPVGKYQKNGCQLYDMAGNVQQWCQDWFDTYQKERVVRGGSWNSSTAEELLSSHRDKSRPDKHDLETGFRCVVELVSPPEFSLKVARFRELLGIDEDDKWQTVGRRIQQVIDEGHGISAYKVSGDSESRALQKAIQQNAPDKIENAMQQYRDARKSVHADNTPKQQNLLQSLTPQQQAIVLLHGLVH